MILEWKKKPITVKAVKLENTAASIVECVEFVYNIGMESSEIGLRATVNQIREAGGLTVRTNNGDTLAAFGDYIIKGVDGEFYPCTSEVFHATYERYLVWEENI